MNLEESKTLDFQIGEAVVTKAEVDERLLQTNSHQPAR